MAERSTRQAKKAFYAHRCSNKAPHREWRRTKSTPTLRRCGLFLNLTIYLTTYATENFRGGEIKEHDHAINNELNTISKSGVKARFQLPESIQRTLRRMKIRSAKSFGTQFTIHLGKISKGQPSVRTLVKWKISGELRDLFWR